MAPGAGALGACTLCSLAQELSPPSTLVPFFISLPSHLCPSPDCCFVASAFFHHTGAVTHSSRGCYNTCSRATGSALSTSALAHITPTLRPPSLVDPCSLRACDTLFLGHSLTRLARGSSPISFLQTCMWTSGPGQHWALGYQSIQHPEEGPCQQGAAGRQLGDPSQGLLTGCQGCQGSVWAGS